MASRHFDKLLCTALLIYFTAVAWHAYHFNEHDLAMMAADQSKYFAGALLGLITGRALSDAEKKGLPTNQLNPQPEEKKEL